MEISEQKNERYANFSETCSIFNVLEVIQLEANFDKVAFVFNIEVVRNCLNFPTV